VKLTTQLHLVPRLRMRRAVHPLLQNDFTAWCLVKHRDNFALTIYWCKIFFEKFIAAKMLENFPVLMGGLAH
jgi:hypothetical protein